MSSDDQDTLFPLPPPGESRPRPIYKTIDRAVWTHSKARLVAEYIRRFTYVTKHGTYLDAFAGPQEPGEPEMWAARLVLELEPKRVRHFHLFERDPAGVRALDGLAVQHHGGERTVLVHSGDMNVELVQWLAGRPISEREATFCLLDQRMFECRWSTLEALARYKREGLKIELFYFLAEKWFHRSLAAQRDPLTPIEWWGRPDYEALYGLRRWERAGWFVERFRRELGYGFAAAWPILARSEAGAPVMYYMIHATDHPEARELMARAYRAAVLPKGQQEHFGWRLLQQQGSPPAAEVLEELGLLEDLPPEHD